MSVTVTIDASEVNAMLSRLSDAGRGRALGSALLAGALLVEGDAKRRAPVDTGTLRNSIRAEQQSDTEATVGTPVEYAPFVEYGTSRQAAQPYLRPALEQNRDAIVATVTQVIRNAL